VVGAAGHDGPHFVVQHHAATSDHYDFRLEIDGVLVSWAVPKGPSTNPKDKRLAVRTEDRPLEYETFEGVIPEGEYGAGRVIVWDQGTYRNESGHPMADGLKQGHLSFWLDGEKLHGGFALTRIRDGKHETWLLVKKSDEYADARRNPVRSQPQSVLSGRTVDELS
jgi:DNA ligase D-like protein (predicted 3'-phosphoesterase)